MLQVHADLAICLFSYKSAHAKGLRKDQHQACWKATGPESDQGPLLIFFLEKHSVECEKQNKTQKTLLGEQILNTCLENVRS